MRIGIYAPYGRQETTWLALDLAEWARQRGHHVSYFASATVQDVVDPRWDNAVVCTPVTKLRCWAADQDFVFWFDVPPHPEKVCGGCLHQAHMIGWHRLRPSDAETWLPFMSHLLSPCRAAVWRVMSRFPHLKAREFCWVPPERKWNDSDKVQQPRVFCHLGRRTCQKKALVTVRLLSHLQTLFPHYTFTCHLASTIPKQPWKFLRELSHPDLVVVTGLTRMQWPAAVASHNWFWETGVDSDSGIEVLQAISLGLRTVTYAVAPFSEFADEAAGCSIPCRAGTNWLGAISALPERQAVVDAFQSLPRRMTTPLAEPPVLEQRRRQFRASWEEIVEG